MYTPLNRHHRLQIAVPAMLLIALGSSLIGCTDDHKVKPPPSRYSTMPPKQVPEFLKGTVLEKVDLTANEPSPVSGYGLVTGLNGTGGGPYPTLVRQYMIKQMVKHGFGSKLHPDYENLIPEDLLRRNDTAIVRVDAYIPPGARKKQKFDVQASALPGSNTTSLAGGTLYNADLAVNGANPRAPGAAINVQASTRSRGLFVNPAYAVNAPTTRSASLRTAVAMDAGVAEEDRPLLLRIRQPEFRMARAIENRVDQHFQVAGAAQAHDEGLVMLTVPEYFNGDWDHFANICTHLYLVDQPAFNAAKAQQLAAEAVKPDAPLMDISYCWEGLGGAALPAIEPLMTDANPDVAFAAARAGVFIGDPAAQAVLMDMARISGHKFQLSAVQTLGQLPSSPSVDQMLRRLLNEKQNTVRVEAYEILAKRGDHSITPFPIGDKFILDLVPSEGPPMIYATRTGFPRIAIFGVTPSLSLPATFIALGNRLSITSQEGDKLVTIFYRPPTGDRPQPVMSRPDVAELVARLGGEGGAAQMGVDFSYGDIVGMLQSMSQSQKLASVMNGQRVPVAFVLQEAPAVMDEIERAPVIEDNPGRPQQTEEPRQIGSLTP